MQNLWIQEASKSGQFVTKKVDTNVNPADLLMGIVGYEFVEDDVDSKKCRSTGTQ